MIVFCINLEFSRESAVIPSQRTDSSATHPSLLPVMLSVSLNISVYSSLAQSFPLKIAYLHVGTGEVHQAVALCFQPKFIAQVNRGYAFTSVLLASTSTDLPDFLSNVPCCKLLDITTTNWDDCKSVKKLHFKWKFDA